MSTGRIFYRLVSFGYIDNFDPGVPSASSTDSAAPTSLASPTGLNAVKAGTETAKISWNVVSGATSYEAQYQNKAGEWKADTDYKTKTATSYTSTGLGLYDSYKYRIRAVSSAGQTSAWSEVTYTKTTTTTPKPELQVLSTTEGNYTVTIPANYTLDCYQTPTATTRYTYMSSKTVAYNLSCTKRLSMSDGTTRYFFVSADNKQCYFVYTNSMNVRDGVITSTGTVTTLPKPSVSVSGSNVTVSWTTIPNSNQLDIYLILVDENSTNGTIIERVSAKSITTCTLRDLSNSNYSVSLTTNLYTSGISSEKNRFSIAQARTVIVQYNANGGNGAPSSETVALGGNYTVSSRTPTKTGYNFKGWSTSSSDFREIVSSGQVLNNLNNNITLYAVWSITLSETISCVVTIQYNANGGSGAPASHNATKDKYGDVSYTLSSTTPSRSGYRFLGWRFENSTAYAIDMPGQSISFSTGNPSSNETFTYYAQWDEVPVTKITNTIG